MPRGAAVVPLNILIDTLPSEPAIDIPAGRLPPISLHCCRGTRN